MPTAIATLNTNTGSTGTGLVTDTSLLTTEIKAQLKWKKEKLAELLVIKGFIESNRHDIDHYIRDKHYQFYLSDNDKIEMRLDSECWSKMINASGIKHLMTTIEQQKMTEELTENPQPFTVEAATEQFEYYVGNANQLFAKRVEGIFERLSGEHVTNRPGRFSEKLIFAGFGCKYRLYENKTAAAVHDLRCAIAILQKDFTPICEHETQSIIRRAMNDRGETLSVDGNSFTLKIFKKGTAHIVIESDIADQLNDVLAFLYPLSIADASEARKLKNAAAKKLSKEFVYRKALVPQDLRDLLRDRKLEKDYDLVKSNDFRREYDREYNGKYFIVVNDEKLALIESVLGELVLETKSNGLKQTKLIFESDISAIIRDIVCNGHAPLDKVDSQFYQTTSLLRGVIEDDLVDMDFEGKRCLEPSAGYGVLASLLPAESTCIDISSFNVDVLKSKGFVNAKVADFMVWAQEESSLYDLILMNPPFSGNRYLRHVEAALSLLKAGGHCYAVLPNTALSKLDVLKAAYNVKVNELWKGTERFEGTSKLGIVVLRFDKNEKSQNQNSILEDILNSF